MKNFRKHFLYLLLVVLILVLWSCEFSFLGGPFDKYDPDNNDLSGNPDDEGLVFWVDGESLYSRGLMRFIVEDFGTDSQSRKTFTKKIKAKSAKTIERSSSNEPDVVYGMDWYASPIHQARLIFEVGVPDGRYGDVTSFASGYNTTIGFRLMLPASAEMALYSAVRVSTSATNTDLKEVTLTRSHFHFSVNSADYLRTETIGSQRRLDILFPHEFRSYVHNASYDRVLSQVLRPIPKNFSVSSFPNITRDLMASNAFGLNNTPVPYSHGNLVFDILENETVVSSYTLEESQIKWIRDLFVGNTLETNFFARTYNATQTYAQTNDEWGKPQITVTRTRDGADPCSFSFSIQNLGEFTLEQMQGVHFQARKCLPVGGNTWDQNFSEINNVTISADARGGKLIAHIPRDRIDPYEQAEFTIDDRGIKLSLLDFSFVDNNLEADAEMRVLYSAIMTIFLKDRTLLGINEDPNYLVTNFDSLEFPQTLFFGFYPTLEQMASSGTRIAPLYYWVPQEEVEKMRDYFNPQTAQ